MKPSFYSVKSIHCIRSTRSLFYDSQSGKHIKESPKGIRLHDCSCRDSQTLEDVVKLLNTHDSTLSSTTRPATFEISSKLILSTPSQSLATSKFFSSKWLCKVTTCDEIRKLKTAHTNFPSLVGVSIVTNEECLKSQLTFDLIKAAVTLDLIPHVTLQSAAVFETSADLLDTVNTIASLADIGAQHIIYSPYRHPNNSTVTSTPLNIDSDTAYRLQILIEECFGVDIEGDPMTQRLGFSCSDASLVRHAIQLGISRLSVTSISTDVKSKQVSSRELCSSCCISIEEAQALIEECSKETSDEY